MLEVHLVGVKVSKSVFFVKDIWIAVKLITAFHTCYILFADKTLFEKQ